VSGTVNKLIYAQKFWQVYLGA